MFFCIYFATAVSSLILHPKLPGSSLPLSVLTELISKNESPLPHSCQHCWLHPESIIPLSVAFLSKPTCSSSKHTVHLNFYDLEACPFIILLKVFSNQCSISALPANNATVSQLVCFFILICPGMSSQPLKGSFENC